jgi:Ser/Thr protein kinase RdoA (MazF antagonist)
LLANWDLDPIVSTELFATADYRHSDRVVFIQTESRRYVLKRTRVLPAYQFSLLSTLASHGVPVAVPLLARDGVFFVRQAELFYCLSPYLAGEVITDPYAAGAEGRIRSLGAAIAGLHTGLKACEKLVPATAMDLPRDVAAGSQVLRERYILASLDEILAAVNAHLAEIGGELPVQLIHRDAHAHNVLFLNDRVSGWLDFELLTRGPRLFDLGYCSTSLLMAGWEDPAKQLLWFDLLRELVQGYSSVNPLTPAERAAFGTVLLSIEVIFAAYFIKEHDEKGVEQNLSALGWIYQNRNQV